MSHSYTVCGYTYQADIYCPEHVCEAVALDARRFGVVPGRMDYEDAEDYLKRMAPMYGIKDRTDEYTFDSDQFPKVIFLGHACDMDHDYCAACGDDLSGCDPEGDEIDDAYERQKDQEFERIADEDFNDRVEVSHYRGIS